MSKPAMRTWAVGTTATGVVLSIAGVGLVTVPAWGADSGNCPVTGGPYDGPLPVEHYNDSNNLEYTETLITGYSYKTQTPDPTDKKPIPTRIYATYSSNLWYNFDKQDGSGNGQICIKWSNDADHDHYYDARDKGVLKDDTYVPPS